MKKWCSSLWAAQAGSDRIEAVHVRQAIDEREYRASRIRERSLEQIQRGVVMIATEGSQVGQVNGLFVLQLGATRFGQPTRITATARPGKGQFPDELCRTSGGGGDCSEFGRRCAGCVC
jgi:predicted ATP-dependent protease